MNYLAHFLLGSATPGRLTGSLLGDFCRGRLEALPYQGEVLEGIRLHRHVDSLTDAHPRVVAGRARFGRHRRLAGIALDLIYDHFLARHWPRFASEDLESFAARTYAVLSDFHAPAAPGFASVVARMREHNWLCAYREFESIALALHRIEQRRPRLAGLGATAMELERLYPVLEQDFLILFPQLRAELRV